jgi:hypothetical protein
MTTFIEAWRKYRDLGLENFLYAGNMYSTRRVGETTEEWNAALEKNKMGKTAAGRSAAADEAPLTRAAVANSREDDNPSITRTMSMVRERALNLYTRGDISDDGYAAMMQQADAVDKIRFGEPADTPEYPGPVRQDFDMPVSSPRYFTDEDYIVPGEIVAGMVGDEGMPADAIASVLSANQAGTITQRQAGEVLRKIERQRREGAPIDVRKRMTLDPGRGA